MRNDELMEAMSAAVRAMQRAAMARANITGALYQRQLERVAVRAVLATLRDLGPSEEMAEAAGATPGVKAVNAAMQMHQARGYGFADGSFDDGSPLHQMHRAMLSSLLGDPR